MNKVKGTVCLLFWLCSQLVVDVRREDYRVRRKKSLKLLQHKDLFILDQTHEPSTNFVIFCLTPSKYQNTKFYRTGYHARINPRLMKYFSVCIMYILIMLHYNYYSYLKRDESCLMGSGHTRSSVPNWLVCDSEFTQIHTNHFWFHFNTTKHLSIVDTNNRTNHFRNDNHIT